MTEPKRVYPRIDTTVEPQDGDILVYDESTDLWVPTAP